MVLKTLQDGRIDRCGPSAPARSFLLPRHAHSPQRPVASSDRPWKGAPAGELTVFVVLRKRGKIAFNLERVAVQYIERQLPVEFYSIFSSTAHRTCAFAARHAGSRQVMLDAAPWQPWTRDPLAVLRDQFHHPWVDFRRRRLVYLAATRSGCSPNLPHILFEQDSRNWPPWRFSA